MQKSVSSLVTLIVFAFVLTIGGRQALASEMVYNSFNAAGVSNGPTVDTTFTLSKPTTISSLVNYHWNYGWGVDPNAAAGWIGIAQVLADGTTVEIGKWPAIGKVGAYNSPNVLWVVSPNVLLDAGTYKVIDSNPDTWSFADYSYAPYGYPDGANWELNKGFTQIFTAPTATATLPANNATDVATKQQLTITFSENVVQGPSWSGITASYVNYSGTKPTVVNVPLYKNLKGNVLKLTPSNSFRTHALVTVKIPAGSVVDLGTANTVAGNLDAAPSGFYQYTFTTVP